MSAEKRPSPDDAPIVSPFEERPPSRPRFQFTLLKLLLAMAAFSVIAGALAGLVRARNNPDMSLVLIAIIAGPIFIAALVGLAFELKRYLSNPKRWDRW
ncbi:MAG: hypothetical protein HYS13_22730 [Planctomycetia bacterium]|nr:hypothetical protein [Planctomycetia bacterium]